jgi:hypothetical protein
MFKPMSAGRLPSTAVRIYYDFETTGYLPAGRVVQFGAICEERRFNQLVNPGVPIPEETSKVHGIHDADVADAPGFAEAWLRFLAFVKEAASGRAVLLIGFNNWSFDDKLLFSELARRGMSPSEPIWTADAKRALETACRKGLYKTERKKLGFVYEPSDTNGVYYMTFYKNGIPLADKKQIPSAAGTDFPNDVRMGFVFAVLNATASTPGTFAGVVNRSVASSLAWTMRIWGNCWMPIWRACCR